MVRDGKLVLASCRGTGTGATCHRAPAAESCPASRMPRTSRPMAVRPDDAASCSRRVAARSSARPSATTAATAGLRRARSMAHRRAASSGGLMSTLEASSSRRGSSGSIKAWTDGHTRWPIHSTSRPGPVRRAQAAMWVSMSSGGVSSSWGGGARGVEGAGGVEGAEAIDGLGAEPSDAKMSCTLPLRKIESACGQPVPSGVGPLLLQLVPDCVCAFANSEPSSMACIWALSWRSRAARSVGSGVWPVP